MNLRSPLRQVLGSGSAKEGTDHWWGQRVSAIGLLLLGLWFMLSLLQLDSFEHDDVVQWAGRPLSSIMLVLLSLTLGYHSKLGIQVIIEDYVHGSTLKVAALISSQFFHVFVVIAAVFAVLKIAFGVLA